MAGVYRRALSAVCIAAAVMHTSCFISIPFSARSGTLGVQRFSERCARSTCHDAKDWSMMADGVDGGSEERETVGGPAVTRRSFAAAASVALPALMLRPQEAAADILDVVTGSQKSNDFLARLKVGKVYIPTLVCNSSMPCWDDSNGQWYDFPTEFEGYTESPSGLQLKDLGTRSDLANLIDKAPMPNAEEGTNSIEIFSAGYIIDGASPEAIAEYYDTTSKKSKYYDIRNKDPRLFQMQSIVLTLGKSKLIPGFQEGVSTMRVGLRRSFIVPAALAYGEAGTPKQGQFLQAVPPNANLLFNVELVKILRG